VDNQSTREGAQKIVVSEGEAGEEHFMRLALREAQRAREHGDVPIGAVVARAGEVIAVARNERELRQDPTAHAEILALRAAAQAFGSWRVLETTLYVTLEPCAMCAGAIVLARVPRVVYGAPPEPPPRSAGRTARRGVRSPVERVLRLAPRREMI